MTVAAPRAERPEAAYRLDRLTDPKLGPLHEIRPATAVSLFEVVVTLISEKPRGAAPPGSVQGGCGSTYSMIP
jgi:hypothetical protein